MATIQGYDDEAWQRLGREIEVQRVTIGMTQEEAAATAKISPTTWRLLEQGKQHNVRTLTMAAVAGTLDWSVEAPIVILNGGQPQDQDPELRDSLVEERLDDLGERLERVEELLGQLVDSQEEAS